MKLKRLGQALKLLDKVNEKIGVGEVKLVDSGRPCVSSFMWSHKEGNQTYKNQYHMSDEELLNSNVPLEDQSVLIARSFMQGLNELKNKNLVNNLREYTEEKRCRYEYSEHYGIAPYFAKYLDMGPSRYFLILAESKEDASRWANTNHVAPENYKFVESVDDLYPDEARFVATTNHFYLNPSARQLQQIVDFRISTGRLKKHNG